MDRLINRKWPSTISCSDSNQTQAHVPSRSRMEPEPKIVRTTNDSNEANRKLTSKNTDKTNSNQNIRDELPSTLTKPNFVSNSDKEARRRRISTDTDYASSFASQTGSESSSCGSGALVGIGMNPLLSEIPNDCEAALLYLSKLFPTEYFNGRLPAIILSSQLNSILQQTSISTIESQLKYLIYSNKIIIFPTFANNFSSKSSLNPLSSNYLIVFYNEFVQLKKHQVDVLFQQFVTDVLPYQSTKESNNMKDEEDDVEKLSTHDIIKNVNLLRLIPKEGLIKLLKIKDENDVRRLVNGGYLGIQDNQCYCLSLPGAGEFIKVMEKGRKVVLGNIRKAKFGEILQQELEKRSFSKTAPLGVAYHIADLIGSGVVQSMETTSGPLLRFARNH